MINWWKTVISQYANSPRLQGLIDTFNEAVDPRALIQIFYDHQWNIDTATEHGLDVWGRVVGVERTILVPTMPLYLGFASATPGVTTFGFGPWYSGQNLQSRYTITDDGVFRRLIFAKAATNITNGSITSTNKILMDFFAGRGNAYVREEPSQPWHYFGFAEAGGASGFNQNGAFGDYLQFRKNTMRVTYVFDFDLEDYEKAIVLYSPAIPRPAGVHVAIEVNT